MTLINKKNSNQSANSKKNMMYENQVRHSPFKTTQELYDFIIKILKPKKVAVILHDKDVNDKGEPVEPHWHASMSFENERSANNIAKLMGEKPQHIEYFTGRTAAANCFSYLIHATENAKHLYQYDPSEVIANFGYTEYVDNITKEVSTKSNYANNKLVDAIIDSIYAGEINVEQAEEMLPASVFSRHEARFESTFNRYLRKLARAWREMMIELGESVIVIWLFGVTRTGKSSFAIEYAKKYAEMYDTDYYKSGSTRDPFQRYDGSRVIILDELRANVIEYSDFLRLLDPFSTDKETMGGSRHRDKGIACAVWIVTSPYDPYKFYEKYSKIDREVDTFDQLNERLDYVIKMTQDEIIETKFDEITNTYRVVNTRHNPYSKKNRPPQIRVSRGLDLLEDMTGFSRLELIEQESENDGFKELTDSEQQELPFDL